MRKPVIAVTMGDPSGNGPELCIKALASGRFHDIADILVVGDALAMKAAMTFPCMPHIEINSVTDISHARFSRDALDVLDIDLFKDTSQLHVGSVDPLSGMAAFLCVRKAISLAMSGAVDATVTNALNKEAMNIALKRSGGEYSDGITHFDGHTEIYAHYTNAKSYCMMLVHGKLRVSHVTTHCSLREACDRVRKSRVLEVIRLTYEALLRTGIDHPRIAVAGLNPHAGEHGMFGREEIEEIAPAIEDARELGIDVRGPYPPDSVFSEALGGLHDAVVAMYHDQGHIPIKTVGFIYDSDTGCWKSVEGVNITLGLPIIRTSVDHGTGFALAGTGKCSEQSLVNAIDIAIAFANGRRK